MLQKLNNMRLPIGFDKTQIEKEVRKKIGDCRFVKLDKLSIDSRRKNDIHYVASVVVDCKENNKLLPYNPPKTKVGELVDCNIKLEKRPVIIGSGPCGLFAGLTLAEFGLKPIIFERGEKVENRSKIVANFNNGGVFNEKTNIQFGEGGAGTFSDGKLNTGISSEYISIVLNEFVNYGANEDILYNSKPHIGTDILEKVVANMRARIEHLGGEYRFNCRVEDFIIQNEKIIGVVVNGEKIDCDIVLLACGHSARDTIKTLYSKGVHMSAKAFAVGARVEHSQELIDKAQYGTVKGLPPADYKLSHRLSNGRGCFTFCMCPGGYVMPSMSEADTIVTNGMSEYKRDSGYANSAILVGVEPCDFGGGVLDGFYYQEKLEKTAFKFGKNYSAPAVKVADFIKGNVSRGMASVKHTYARGLVECNFDELLPQNIVQGMREGLVAFGKKLNGFDKNGILIGVESRSSSPVRVERGENGMSNIAGLYPCGEGAGYAGGITSSAVDGIKTALKVVENNK